MKTSFRSVCRIIGVLLVLFQATNSLAAIQVFNLLDMSFADGTASASGTVTIDTTAGIFTNIQITITDTSPTYGSGTAVFSSIFYQGGFQAPIGTYGFLSYSEGNDRLDFSLPPLNLVGYAGGPICYGFSTCGSPTTYVTFFGKNINFTTGGALSPVPNPASAWLLVSGLCVLVAAKRRASSVK